MLFLYIALGGAMGAVTRYLLSNWVFGRFGDTIPTGTLAVNIIGSFLLGLIYTLSLQTNLSANTRALVTIGLLGAFTTFSTFSNETLVLLQQGSYKYGLLYLLISIILGLVAVAGGQMTANFFLTSFKKRKEQSHETY